MPMPSPRSALPETARAVIALTAAAWSVAPESPLAVARRAPHGYVPARMRRRLRAADDANTLALAHSW